jgi:S-methylmethionine-dependent homocysteine/selenocysteine methylase
VTLPQLSRSLFIADGGMETTLIFRDGFDLPHFAQAHSSSSRATACSGPGSAAMSLHIRSAAAR